MPVSRHTNQHASALRLDMTRAERTMWFALRDRRLASFKFRRQASIGAFVVDFLCAERKLVVEIDGGQHSGDADAHRTTVIEAAGYRVIRFWNNEVTDNLEGVLMTLQAALIELP